VGTRARLIAARDALRETATSTIRTGKGPPGAARVRLSCRAGLEQLLASELAPVRGVRVDHVEPGRVDIMLAGPLSALFAARLWSELAFEFTGGPAPHEKSGELERALALLTLPAVRELLATLTEGPLRLRVVLAGAGHRRGLIWSLAEALATAAPELVCDSREAPWTATLLVGGRGPDRLLLEPHPEDPRFAWRQADVPAASHPTVAAGLARLALPRAGERVWDPFCGSGGELIECARLAPGLRLLGSDVDAAALMAARQNLDAAGLDATLTRADALGLVPAPLPTLIVTNPPMGRRVRRGDVAELLEAFVARLPGLLAPEGRLVWASALPGRTRAAATRAGLRWKILGVIDMGGFTADVQELGR
jgi:predicted RNA methylase